MLLESQGAESKLSLPRSICHSKEHLEWQKSRNRKLSRPPLLNGNYRSKKVTRNGLIFQFDQKQVKVDIYLSP